MIEYIVRGSAKSPDATVSCQGRDVASIRLEGGSTLLLVDGDGSWKMDPRVQGEIRPFSMCLARPGEPDMPVLSIRNHLFFHRGRAYLLTGIPEDVRPSDHLLGKRHVSRLDTFPFSSLGDVDPETWGRLRKHRGVSVGTIESAEPGTCKVALSEELEEIGLPLAAASYLLYTLG
ncbi:MAG TPA: hypothetical protein VJR06_08640 [Nitrososphaerales archaeon]|nr:hypothetical protein [Nitrososphaerales archaeon]